MHVITYVFIETVIGVVPVNDAAIVVQDTINLAVIPVINGLVMGQSVRGFVSKVESSRRIAIVKADASSEERVGEPGQVRDLGGSGGNAC